MSSLLESGGPEYYKEAPNQVTLFGLVYTKALSHYSAIGFMDNAGALFKAIRLDHRSDSNPVATIRAARDRVAGLYFLCPDYHHDGARLDWPEIDDRPSHCRLINFIISAEHLQQLVK